jgi:hypothetical protein
MNLSKSWRKTVIFEERGKNKMKYYYSDESDSIASDCDIRDSFNGQRMGQINSSTTRIKKKNPFLW